MPMFERFVGLVHAAFVAQQIVARHSLEQAAPPLQYVHPVQRLMFERLSQSQSGVFLHWGAYGSGKSTAALQAGLALQAEGRTVILLQGYYGFLSKDIGTWIKHRLGVPENAQTLSAFLSRPTTIIVDHFDNLMWHGGAGHADSVVLPSVRWLIKDSETSKRFNVLLITSSWERAVRLKRNGCKLVGPPWRWSSDELAELFSTLPESVQTKYSESQTLELINLSVMSGTPDFLDVVSGLSSVLFCKGRARLLDREWLMGTRALAAEEEGGGAVCSDRLEVGRFPDRNGIFHWEDLDQEVQ